MSPLNPVNCGCAIESGKYRINWNSGPEAITVVDVVATEEVYDEEVSISSNDYDCNDNSVSDTDADDDYI